MGLNHNIGITLGDPSGDGHGLYKDYHIISNYSSKEISEVYNNLSKELEWNFTEECQNYEEPFLSEKGEQQLLKFGILTESDIEASKLEWYGNEGTESYTYVIHDGSEFIDIFFKLVKTKIPDLEWEYRELDEEIIYQLDGAGYGLYSL